MLSHITWHGTTAYPSECESRDRANGAAGQPSNEANVSVVNFGEPRVVFPKDRTAVTISRQPA